MADNTGIEWCDATWNPVRARHRATGKLGWYCARVSGGCRFCYAEAINRRLGNGVMFSEANFDDVEIFLDETMLQQPLHWKRPRRIFLNSMSDTFGSWVPGPMLARMYAVMALCPHHEFVVLTKRDKLMRYWTTSEATPGKVDQAMNEVAPQHWCARELEDYGGWPLKNVTTGVSCEDQPTADERISNLLAAAAARRIVSLEPLLGPIDVRPWIHALDGVIVGGESGRHINIRATHVDWVRALRDQCAANSVPFFFKQWGEYAPAATSVPPDPASDVRRLADTSVRVSKKANGAMLDGREHREWPT